MRYIIKEPKYIRRDVVVANYIKNKASNLNVTTKILQGLENANKITDKDVFEYIDAFNYGEQFYTVLENEKGIFIIRADNKEVYYETTKERFEIKDLFISGDKTFLIDNCGGKKFTTTRHKEDKEDIEKAIMLLLLKREGYTYKDITDLVAEMDYNETDKKSTKSNKKEK